MAQSWKTTYHAELSHARQSRAAGNEGMARVCARRAVGALIGEYFRIHGFHSRTPSAYDRLRALLELPTINPALKEVAAHFLLRATPEHNLPIDADLIAEAEFIKEQLEID
ncbi:MAG: hypothetical protein JW726_01210 [Anaerolineales bacterium]|nr:hypothetical protein [Anaerolineales bacterium]